MVIVTGGSGFIGSNFILELLKTYEGKILNIDKLTYAGNPDNLNVLRNNSQYKFIKEDINNKVRLESIFNEYKPKYIINFAAESHVDRSIHGPSEFIQTNIVGTFNLLEASKNYYNKLPDNSTNEFRFIHISTDEVYGSLSSNELPFTESSSYKPNSPYSASKASSDHLVRSYFHTYKLPTIITNCSNNYGPFQFPEKLIPLIIINAINGKLLPIYGDGLQVRDWLYVKDHCNAIINVMNKGKLGETYNIGGNNEKTNIYVVKYICKLLNRIFKRNEKQSFLNQITFVRDRPGHDKRYAINNDKITKQLNWTPLESFESGIEKTVKWYLENDRWIDNIVSGRYTKWIEKNYDVKL